MMRFIYLSIYHLCCHYIIIFAISTSDFYKNLSVALTLYCTSHPDVNRTTYLIQLNLLSHGKSSTCSQILQEIKETEIQECLSVKKLHICAGDGAEATI